VKTVGITELRQRAADVIEDASTSDEPTVVLQRNRKAAYIVSPDRFDQDQAELRALRRALFLTEVREAEGEYAAGDAEQFNGVEELLDRIRS
jgi:prevent-host-death family protein